jgi:hypothetical protein
MGNVSVSNAAAANIFRWFLFMIHLRRKKLVMGKVASWPVMVVTFG